MDIKEIESILKLSQNENPFGPSPLALKAVREHSERMNRYPEPHAKTLKERFAEHLGLRPENLFVCAGLVESLDIIIRNFIENDEKLVIPKITFVAYRLLAEVFGVDLRLSEMKDYKIDIDSVIENCDSKTKVVILANPNNPTGTIIPQDDLVKLLEHVSQNTYVVSDEAYCEYQDDKNYPDSLALQKKYPNLIVLRTFSKIYGLAGLRVGFVVATPKIIEKLEYYQAPFTVNIIAAIAASAAIKDDKFVKDSFEKNVKSRTLLAQEFSSLGYKVIPSQSNFIYIYFKSQKERDGLYDKLIKQNVFIRKTDLFGDSKALRITVPKPKNCQKIIDCLS